jgi:hypothetical protein
MDEAIIGGINNLHDKIADLEVSLAVAEEQVLYYKAKAAKADAVPKLQAKIKKLELEIRSLSSGREKILRSL